MESIKAAVHIVNCEESNPSFKATKAKSLRKKSRLEAQQKRNVIDLLNSENLLQNLFPFSRPGVFSESHFKRNPVVARGNQDCLRRLKKLLFNLDIPELIKSSASDRIHVWLSQRLPGGLTSNALESIPVEDHVTAVKLYWAGHSIYCRAPLELEKAVVPKLLNELGLGVTGSGTDRYRRGEIELFLSRAGHVTDFHTDFQENFTIQLSGTKKWIFRESTAVAPLRGCTPHFKALGKDKSSSSSSILGFDQTATDLNEQQIKVLRLGDSSFSARQYVDAAAKGEDDARKAGQEHFVVLGPGDVMYHPAGIWHRVECEEDSVSINISLIVSSCAEIFCSGLLQLLWENPIFRESVSSGGAENDNAAKSLRVMECMMSAVPSLLANMKATDFLPAPCINNSAMLDDDSSNDDGDGDDDDAGDENDELPDCRTNSHSSSGNGKKTEKDEDNDENDDDDDDDEDDGEEEEEEEEEEEGNHNALDPIFADKVKIPSDPHIRNFDARYRINPLVKVVTSSDLRFFERGAALLKDAQSTSEAYIIHSGFGNETFESVLRQVVVVPDRMAPAAAALAEAIAEHQVRRQVFYAQLNEKATGGAVKRKRSESGFDAGWGNSGFLSVNGISEKCSAKCPDRMVVCQLLQAFVAAGALTLCSDQP